MVFCTISMYETIQKNIEMYFQKEEFALSKALINSRFPVDQVIQSISKSSYVKKVKLSDVKDVKNKIEKDLNHYQIDLTSDLFFRDFHYYHIYFKPTIDKTKFEAFRSSMEDILGIDNVIIGGLQTPFLSFQDNKAIKFIIDWGAHIIVAMLALFYMWMTFSICQAIKGRSFILSSFIRRQHIKYKIFLSGFAFMSVISIFPSILLSAPLQLTPALFWLALAILTGLLFVFTSKSEQSL